MREILTEKYSRQIKIAEAYAAKNFGTSISENVKFVTAALLENTNRWLTEAMNTQATERANLGDFKKFCFGEN